MQHRRPGRCLLLVTGEPAAVRLRPMERRDWTAVEEIYAEGIGTGNATFESRPPTWEEFDAAKLRGHRTVAVDGDDVVLGWIAAAAVSARPVYRGVVEHSVYVAERARGQRVGHALLDALVDSTERAGIWTIQSGVFPENTASRALHAAHGFRELGVRERIGLMPSGPWQGQWRDTVVIERRSAVAGR